jgi:mono/diheme cytochrome c family protein
MKFPVFLLIANLALAGVAFAQLAKEAWHAPTNAATKTNPLAGKPNLAMGGQKLFSKNCAVCHDAGEEQKGPHLALPVTQKQSDGELFWKISSGNARSGMPSFSSLPEGQRWQLVLYIRTLAP